MSIEKAEITEVTDKINLHRYIGTPFNEGNISCIAMEWGLVFIDAGARMDKAKDFRNLMEKKFQKPSKILILTHTDGDHTQGMGAFADLLVIVSELGMQTAIEEEKEGVFTKEFRQKTIENIIKKGEEENTPVSDAWKNDFAPRFIEAKIVVPHISFKNQMFLKDRTQSLTLTLIQGHTPCSIVIQYSSTEENSKNILFTGDNLNAEHADNSGCMLMRSLNSLEQMENILAMDINTFVPGHGPVVDKDYVLRTYTYLTEMKSKLAQLKERNVPMDEAIIHPTLPVFYEAKVPDFLPKVMGFWYEYFI